MSTREGERMMSDPFADRTEISAEEYRSFLAQQRQTIFVPPMTTNTEPDWRTSEKAFMAKVDGFAKEHGWLVYHTWKSANSSPGYPDLCLVRGGRLVFAELKIPPNRPTVAQRQWLQALALCGVDVFVWVPADWESIEEAMAA